MAKKRLFSVTSFAVATVVQMNKNECVSAEGIAFLILPYSYVQQGKPTSAFTQAGGYKSVSGSVS
jgi:hypothetical protein